LPQSTRTGAAQPATDFEIPPGTHPLESQIEMSQTTNWEIHGAESQTIFGTAYLPDDAPLGCALIAHGFKGYKDFRMIPAFARGLCQAGFVAHAFNFSHSGMTANPDTFERPDLFELDTWNKQIFDIQCVVEAISAGRLAGTGLPYVLLGHSRGGVSAILFAGRQNADSQLPRPAGVITAGSPDNACGMSDSDKNELRDRGYLESPSARTGQILRVGSPWLKEQEADRDAHDVLGNVRKITCPMLVVHGENDETIDVSSAASIAGVAANAQVARISSCNHVFNAPNPPPLDVREIPALHQATERIVQFSRECCRAG
jgi:pimeloyl-ACP methyl ester carboxylesterase